MLSHKVLWSNTAEVEHNLFRNKQRGGLNYEKKKLITSNRYQWSAFQLYQAARNWIKKKVHLQLRHSNAPLAFQSFIAASMNPNGMQYEMRGPIMKYKNRNKHSFPRLWAVEYSPLFPFSSFALTSVLRERLNYFTYFLIKVTLRNMSASILCRRKLVEIVWWVIWISQYF